MNREHEKVWKLLEVESRIFVDLKYLDVKLQNKVEHDWTGEESYSWYYQLKNHPQYAQIRVSDHKPSEFTDRIYYININDALDNWDLIKYNIKTAMYKGFENPELQSDKPIKLLNKCLRILDHEIYYSQRNKLDNIKHHLLSNLNEELTLETPYGQLFVENGLALGKYLNDGHTADKINFKHAHTIGENNEQ